MRFLALLALASFAPAAAPPDPYAPLWLYQGTWRVTNKSNAAKPDTLVNQCAQLSKFFACGQIVNGQPAALVVFIPDTRKPGHYLTQNIMPEGRATGISELEISGDQWTYSNRRDQDGKTTFYRTTNTFSGKNRIHFEQAQSSNRTDWQVQNSGDEERIGPAARGAR